MIDQTTTKDCHATWFADQPYRVAWIERGGAIRRVEEYRADAPTDADRLTAMFGRAGVRYVLDRAQSRTGSQEGSFVIYVEQAPGLFNHRTWYVVYDFAPDGSLVGVQVNQ